MAPLPPLPANNTDRYFYTIATAVDEYEMQLRTAPGVFAGDIDGFMDSLMTAAAPLLAQTFIVSARFQAQGSDVSIPFSTSLAGNEYGLTTALKIDAPKFISFQGRSIGGYRTSIFFFGIRAAFPIDYRFQAALSVDVTNVLAILGAESGCAIAKNGQEAIWKSYANCGYNSYKERRNRTS